MSVSSGFDFPICSYRVLILLPCNRRTDVRRVAAVFVVNAYSPGRNFTPITIFLGKSCSSVSSGFAGVTAFPENVSDLPPPFNTGITDCYNDSNAPTKSPTTVRKETGTSPGVIATAVIVPILVLITGSVLVTVILVWYYRQRNKIVDFTIEMMTEQYQTSNPLFDRVQTLKPPGPHEKEFSSELITFVRELGEGAFGRVYQGMATNIIEGEDSTIVAVKQLKTDNAVDDNAVMMEFFKEVTFMSKLDHPRIVGLLGVCTITEPYCMIFEYMDLGDLNAYLRSAIGLGPDCDESEKETCFLQLSDLLHIVEQIAEGMEYLSNQGLVHRDLATRNCLVATGLEIKIADFGLSRDINSTDYYRVHGRAVLPIRWMAPESIMYGKFTMATDVWSFGIVMWEVFTYGQQPYVGLTNEEVISSVTKQGTLEPPTGCPPQVTKVMTQCWSQSPGSRPNVSKLHTAIQQLSTTLKDVVFNSPDYVTVACDSLL
ncbi:muscle, skeletal receptor tyrosine-protein kinase-like isoform X2 [Dysidea avara]